MQIRKFAKVFSDDSGVSLVEYALIGALVAVIAIGALTTMGTSLTAKLDEINAAL